MSNRTEGTRRKLRHTPTGRLTLLRLFSTLLSFALIDPEKAKKWPMLVIACLQHSLRDAALCLHHHRSPAIHNEKQHSRSYWIDVGR